MAKYIHLFDTDAEFQAMYNDDEKYIEPWASYTRETDSCDYNKKPGPETMPLRMEFLDDTNIYFGGNSGDVPYEDVKVNKNGSGWVSITAYTSESPLAISAGDILEWVGDYENYFYFVSDNEVYWARFAITADPVTSPGANESYQPRVKLSGNIMSLINSTGFSGVFDFTQPYVFGNPDGSSFIFSVFSLADISELVLPATGLTDYCYASLFNRIAARANIDTFTTAPALPATTLAEGCYAYMFQGASTLTTAPDILATTLANKCCYFMFAECNHLTSGPVLFATTLPTDVTMDNNCYSDMFDSCSDLASLTVLVTGFTDEYWASNYMSRMLGRAGTNVTSPVLYCANADAAAAFNDADNRKDIYMDENWTVQVAQ